MTGPWPYLVALPAAYLVGSIPFGVLVGRLWAGIDIRTVGSGNSGATNMLRSVGPVPAALVLLADLGKGVAAVLIARFVSDSSLVASLAATVAIAGHSWPVFARFRGGRGVATGVGALFLVSWVAGTFALIGLVVVIVSRYVSLGSIVGTTAGLLALVVLAALGSLDPEYLIFGFIGAGVILVRHHSNIGRLLRGEEHRLGDKPVPPVA
ncbi:MAG: glycerol-3-phosphate 1-O-acyltransferase PlsY [SAR202 cluster bacterium]|nr:glycerol-3-phosphate 1-O-acyltransferase PlsY [SAR202 cluster bacterium]